jgi:hypothetical protein
MNNYGMLLSAMMVLAPAAFGNPPKWFDTHVAGYALAFDARHGQAGVYDPKRDFYMVRGIECDGGHVELLLTRDRKEVVNRGFSVPSLNEKNGMPLQTAPLRNLATGKGIEIGTSAAAVRRRLGTPTRMERTGNRKQFLNYVYHWRDVKNGVGAEWTNTYVFKADHLIEISFRRDAVPGC